MLKIKHKDTFNFEQYNKDVVKNVDKHNKQLMEYYDKKFSEEIEYRGKSIGKYLNRKSIFINYAEGQYEEIFGHN